MPASEELVEEVQFSRREPVVEQIGDRPLYIGDRYAAGADAVVHDLTSTFAADDVPVLSITLRELPLTTHHCSLRDGYNDPEDFAAAMETARELYDEVLKGNRPGPMLVNCAMGVSRSSTTIAVLLAATEDMTFEAAVEEVQTYREQASPNSPLAELATDYL